MNTDMSYVNDQNISLPYWEQTNAQLFGCIRDHSSFHKKNEWAEAGNIPCYAIRFL